MHQLMLRCVPLALRKVQGRVLVLIQFTRDRLHQTLVAQFDQAETAPQGLQLANGSCDVVFAHWVSCRTSSPLQSHHNICTYA